MLVAIRNILTLCIFAAALYQPIVWVVLLIWLYLSQDMERAKQNEQTLTEAPQSEPLVPVQSPKIHPSDKSYLQSVEWNINRIATLRRDGFTCQGCLADNIPLEVHHTTYDRYGDEKLSDLVSVCRECHQSIHDTYGYDYNDTFPLIK